jgi:hypothetical protein
VGRFYYMVVLVVGGYWLVFENVSASKCALSFSAADTPIRASKSKFLERNVTYAVG